MSQEDSLNMLDKYFQPGRITQIIGESPSLKESFISIYIAHKAIKTCTKVIYIYSKPTLNMRYMYETHKKFDKNFSEENAEKQYSFFEFIKFDSMGDFILKRLPEILEKEKTISTIVLNNLNNFISTTSYKFTHDPKIFCSQLMLLARKYGINVIYLNDIFYYCETKFLYNVNNINYNPELLNRKNLDKNNDENKDDKDDKDDDMNIQGIANMNLNYINGVNNNYINIEENNEIEEYYNKEPVNSDLISEYCSHTLIAESRKPRLFYGNFSEEDFIEQGILRVVKSNYKPHKNYLVTIDKKDFTYNIEIS